MFYGTCSSNNKRMGYWKRQPPFKIIIATILLNMSICIEAVPPERIEHRSPTTKQSLCTTPECVHSASNILKNLDESIEPCDNFYKFACGGFEKNNFLSDDQSHLISFTIILDKLQKQLRTILEEPIEEHEPKSFVLIKKFYDVCTKTSAIEADGLRTAQNLIKKLGGWPVLGVQWNEEDFDWKTISYKLREHGLQTNNFLTLYPGTATENSSQVIWNCDQGTLGLDREYLVKGFNDEFVTGYYNYLVDLAVAFGARKEHALKDLKESVEFEMELANITLGKEDRRNMTALTNVMTLGTVQRLYPTINWIDHLTKLANIPGKIFLADDVIDVGIPRYITDLDGLLRRTSKRAQANYVMSQVVRSIVPFLTQSIRNREMEYNKIFRGTNQMQPRWQECTEAATKQLHIAAGALYVRRYFNEYSKRGATILIDYIRHQLVNVLREIEWMDETTRRKAIQKAIVMRSHVAYPPELLDNKMIDQYYADIPFNADNYLELCLKISKFRYDNSYKQLYEAQDINDWREHSYSTNVNAYYKIVENSMILPAGILQDTFFENNRPAYLNFGSMGFAIAHEMMHGFDDEGAQYDQDGVLTNWWEKQTEKAYLEKTKCIIDQYNGYVEPLTNLKLNGINTQGENIADNGGVKISYLAYDMWIKQNGEELPLPGLDYTPKQLFWISMANLWCSKDRKEFLVHEILEDPHPPSYYRIVGSLSNSEYFARDFKCPMETVMNPSRKCKFW